MPCSRFAKSQQHSLLTSSRNKSSSKQRPTGLNGQRISECLARNRTPPLFVIIELFTQSFQLLINVSALSGARFQEELRRSTEFCARSIKPLEGSRPWLRRTRALCPNRKSEIRLELDGSAHPRCGNSIHATSLCPSQVTFLSEYVWRIVS